VDKKRADQLLVERKLAASRTAAQDMIKEGQVFVLQGSDKVGVIKAGQLLSVDVNFNIESGNAGRFVSRAGLKLDAALNRSKLNVKDFIILDVGLSTGGFADCLLQRGAKKIIGIDVGHGQTHPKIAQDARVQVFEGVNARSLKDSKDVMRAFPPDGFDLIVMDVSFISMTLIVPEVLPYLGKKGFFLGLVKPQFEVGPKNLGKGGIVTDKGLFVDVEEKIRTAFVKNGIEVMDYFPSEIEGKDGNQEYFILAAYR
jgi:23S rRNA (cytidine1920-2'-O)/16S rRNA (cytidine1409-2'-O)-methyltransferase